MMIYVVVWKNTETGAIGADGAFTSIERAARQFVRCEIREPDRKWAIISTDAIEENLAP